MEKNRLKRWRTIKIVEHKDTDREERNIKEKLILECIVFDAQALGARVQAINSDNVQVSIITADTDEILRNR